MTKTAEHRLRSQAAVAAIGAALLFAAWRVLSLGLADHFAERDPGASLAWRDTHPAALLGLAGREGATADDVEALAKRALHADPLNGSAYRRLGEAAAARGEAELALRMYSLAAVRSPRDLHGQTWLADYYLRHGDFAQALAHLDPILRVEPTQVKAALPVLVALAQSPAAQPALADLLQSNPPWRASALTLLASGATDVDAMSGLFERLRTSDGALNATETAAWLDRLGREERWGQAYLIWASQLSPERLAKLGNVANGGFEYAPGQGGFDWRLLRVAGARIDRVATAGATGARALRVAFEDRRVPFAHVRQLLALPPGSYRLSGEVRTENLRTERGLVWTVECAGSGGQHLVDSPPFRGHGGWREFSADFVVPDGCGGQWLILRLPARIPAEQRIGGQVWFDEIRVRRHDASD